MKAKVLRNTSSAFRPVNQRTEGNDLLEPGDVIIITRVVKRSLEADGPKVDCGVYTIKEDTLDGRLHPINENYIPISDLELIKEN